MGRCISNLIKLEQGSHHGLNADTVQYELNITGSNYTLWLNTLGLQQLQLAQNPKWCQTVVWAGLRRLDTTWLVSLTVAQWIKQCKCDCYLAKPIFSFSVTFSWFFSSLCSATRSIRWCFLSQMVERKEVFFSLFTLCVYKNVCVRNCPCPPFEFSFI